MKRDMEGIEGGQVASDAALSRDREGILAAALPTAVTSASILRRPASSAGAVAQQPLGRLVSDAAPAPIGAVNNARQQVGNITGVVHQLCYLHDGL